MASIRNPRPSRYLRDSAALFADRSETMARRRHPPSGLSLTRPAGVQAFSEHPLMRLSTLDALHILVALMMGAACADARCDTVALSTGRGWGRRQHPHAKEETGAISPRCRRGRRPQSGQRLTVTDSRNKHRRLIPRAAESLIRSPSSVLAAHVTHVGLGFVTFVAISTSSSHRAGLGACAAS